MSDESLSQNQVESLIKAMESVDGAPTKAPTAASVAADQNSPRPSSINSS